MAWILLSLSCGGKIMTFDATILALQRNLDMRSLAHSLHSSNVANANVPGYHSRKIDFEEQLREAVSHLELGDETLARRQDLVQEAVEKVTGQIYEDPLAKPNGDGNTVNVDKEMAAIAKNTIGFQTAIQLINKKLAMQKYVLGEGGVR
jgi:flagellar basal-body rod protein FlgB